MKALTMIQPFATFLVAGVKRFETRCWSTPYRGRLAITSSQTPLPAWVKDDPEVAQLIETIGRDRFVSGALLGEVTLVDIHGAEEVWSEVAGTPDAFLGDYTPGETYAWRCVDPVMLEHPPPIKGALRLWDLPEDYVEHHLWRPLTS